MEWYNNVVEEKFHLPYDPDTVAFVVLSTPDMFDLAFKQFLCSGLYTQSKDAIDECVKYYLSKVQEVRYDQFLFMLKNKSWLKPLIGSGFVTSF